MAQDAVDLSGKAGKKCKIWHSCEIRTCTRRKGLRETSDFQLKTLGNQSELEVGSSQGFNPVATGNSS